LILCYNVILPDRAESRCSCCGLITRSRLARTSVSNTFAQRTVSISWTTAHVRRISVVRNIF
jgi:hypothetical protein